MNHVTEQLWLWVLLLAVPTALAQISAVRRYIPTVVHEIATGFIIGPVILGQLAPSLFNYLVNEATIALVSTGGFVVAVVYIYVTGLHIKFDEMPKGEGKRIIVASLASIVIAYVLTFPFAWWQAQHQSSVIGPNGSFYAYIMTSGIILSVAALPVLSTILHEMDALDTRLGRIILAIAVILDGALWIQLAVLLTMSHAPGEEHAANPTLVLILTLLFVAALMIIGRRLLERMIATSWWQNQTDVMKLRMQGIMFLVSAAISHSIGTHYLIGGALAGAIWPNHNRKPILKRTETIIIALFLPLFFGAAGMKTSFRLDAPEVWTTCFIALAVGYTSRIGTAMVLKYVGYTWSEALYVGLALTCRGVAEIVVLTLVLNAGIISPEAFAGFLFAALVATALTKVMMSVALRLGEFLDQSRLTTAELVNQIEMAD